MTIKEATNISGIVLAAGEGKRIGRTKALLEINGKSFLEMVESSLKKVGCKPIIVVGGANANEVEDLSIKLGVNFVLNKNWQSGQFSSLKAGISSQRSTLEGIIITLVDHPFVSTETYELLCESFIKNPGKIVIPVYNNRWGHPIIIPSVIIKKVIKASAQSNLREIIKASQDLIVLLPVNDRGVLQDIDTYEDLEEAKAK